MKRCIKILMTLLSFCFLASLFVACTKQQDSVVKHSIYGLPVLLTFAVIRSSSVMYPIPVTLVFSLFPNLVIE